MKKILFAALMIGLLVPAAAFAAAPAQNPTDYCKANPGLIGAGKLYKNFGACVTGPERQARGQHDQRSKDVQGRAGPRR